MGIFKIDVNEFEWIADIVGEEIVKPADPSRPGYTFLGWYHGEEKVEFIDPALEPISKSTYGLLIYQEQIMQIFQALAGYTLGQADMVRRMMGKKKFDEMAKQKEKFIEGSGKNGIGRLCSPSDFKQAWRIPRVESTA